MGLLTPGPPPDQFPNSSQLTQHFPTATDSMPTASAILYNLTSITTILYTSSFTTPTYPPNTPSTDDNLPAIFGDFGSKPNRTVDIPNFYKYPFGMWLVKVMLPLALLLQSFGHILVGRLYFNRKNRLRLDSGMFLINYIISDNVFTVYVIVAVAIEITVELCPVVNVVYGCSGVAHVFRLSDHIKTLHSSDQTPQCHHIMTRRKEGWRWWWCGWWCAVWRGWASLDGVRMGLMSMWSSVIIGRAVEIVLCTWVSFIRYSN
eukprot:sb/3468449/